MKVEDFGAKFTIYPVCWHLLIALVDFSFLSRVFRSRVRPPSSSWEISAKKVAVRTTTAPAIFSKVSPFRRGATKTCRNLYRRKAAKKKM